MVTTVVGLILEFSDVAKNSTYDDAATPASEANSRIGFKMNSADVSAF